MSLDVVILGEDGRPSQTVSVGLDEHFELIKELEASKSKFFSRIFDYYQDANIQTDELDYLHSELKKIGVIWSSKGLKVEILESICDLISKAKKINKPIHFIAD